jgi:hypothetical protein
MDDCNFYLAINIDFSDVTSSCATISSLLSRAAPFGHTESPGPSSFSSHRHSATFPSRSLASGSSQTASWSIARLEYEDRCFFPFLVGSSMHRAVAAGIKTGRQTRVGEFFTMPMLNPPGFESAHYSTPIVREYRILNDPGMRQVST